MNIKQTLNLSVQELKDILKEYFQRINISYNKITFYDVNYNKVELRTVEAESDISTDVLFLKPSIPQLNADEPRFAINKTVLSDFALYSIIDRKEQKVVCHLVYDNGEEYCNEMAEKMLNGLNPQYVKILPGQLIKPD